MTTDLEFSTIVITVVTSQQEDTAPRKRQISDMLMKCNKVPHLNKP